MQNQINVPGGSQQPQSNPSTQGSLEQPVLDAQLVAYYSSQRERYARLGEQIRLAGADTSSDAADSVREIMGEITKADADAASLRAQWQQSDYQATPALKSVADEVKELIKQLMADNKASTSAVQQAQAEVTMQIEQSVMQQRAAKAYGKS